MSSPPTSCPESPAQNHRWFTEEVQPHGPSLKCYLRSAFPTVNEVEDVVQESYLRLWQARAAAPIRCARGFLFHIARHVVVDLLRRQRHCPIIAVENLATLEVIESRPSASETLVRDEKIELLALAIESLPARCREIVILRKLKFVPQREVAQHLGISEKGVENQLARGLGRCRAFLRKHGVNGLKL